MCGAPDIEQPSLPAQPRVNSDATEEAKRRVRLALQNTGRQSTIKTGPSGALKMADTVRAQLLGGGSGT